MKIAIPESAPARFPLADDRDAIARTLWELTDREYRRATPAYAKVMTNNSVDAAEEDKSPDFSQEAAQAHVETPAAPIAFNQKEWEEKVRKYSALFRKYPEIYNSTVTLQVEQTTSYFVSSEGSKVETPGLMARLVVEANTRADDGMDLVRVETFESTKPDGLPSEKELTAKEEKMASDLKALRASSPGRAFRRPGASFRTSRGRLFPRSAGTSPRRPSTARRHRRTDVHEESESARAARVSECL